MSETKDRLKEVGASAIGSIVDMIDCYHQARDEGQAEYEEGYPVDEDGMRDYINQDPLEVSVKSGYHSPGDNEGAKATEYMILLSTGGPASRIVGDLSEYGEPENARLQVQDWFTPWTDVNTTTEQDDKLLEYCLFFYFGE